MPDDITTRTSTPRKLLSMALSVSLLSLTALSFAQSVASRPSAPIERRTAPAPAPIQRKSGDLSKNRNMTGGKLQGEHLAAWMNHHSTETTIQKLQSLEKEPGFHDLPPQTQQRMRDRLVQLDNMTPERRQQIIDRTEAMEKLSPDQRSQVRTTLAQVAALPPASRRAVQRTFRIVREMAPDQRQAYLNSPDIRSQFTDQERDILQRLMTVEPYLPPGANVTQQP